MSRIVHIEDSPMAWVTVSDFGKVGMYFRRTEEFRPDYGMVLQYGWKTVSPISIGDLSKLISSKFDK